MGCKIPNDGINSNFKNTGIDYCINVSMVHAAFAGLLLIWMQIASHVVLGEHLHGDDCANVYIDLGCNTGVQIRKLYEYVRFDKNVSTMMQLFEEQFGTTNRNSVCSFCFEPNPVHFLKLREMEAVYATHGIRFKHFDYAVSTKNTTLKLFRQNNPFDFAAVLIKDMSHFPPEQLNTHMVNVKVINIIEFLQVHIMKRRLPAGVAKGELVQFMSINAI